MEVEVIYSSTIKILEELSIFPVLYISIIHGVMTYKIVDEILVVEDNYYRYLEFYLEETKLYFLINEEFREYRLERRFPIYLW